MVRLWPVWMTNHPPSVLWHCWLGHQTCKNRRPYNLYCVGTDVKPCSINSDVTLPWCTDLRFTHICGKWPVLQQHVLCNPNWGGEPRVFFSVKILKPVLQDGNETGRQGNAVTLVLLWGQEQLMENLKWHERMLYSALFRAFPQLQLLGVEVLSL